MLIRIAVVLCGITHGEAQPNVVPTQHVRVIKVDDSVIEDIYTEWYNQALGGTFVAIANQIYKSAKVPKTVRQQLGTCTQQAADVEDYAECMVPAIKTEESIRLKQQTQRQRNQFANRLENTLYFRRMQQALQGSALPTLPRFVPESTPTPSAATTPETLILPLETPPQRSLRNETFVSSYHGKSRYLQRLREYTSANRLDVDGTVLPTVITYTRTHETQHGFRRNNYWSSQIMRYEDSYAFDGRSLPTAQAQKNRLSFARRHSFPLYRQRYKRQARDGLAEAQWQQISLEMQHREQMMKSQTRASLSRNIIQGLKQLLKFNATSSGFYDVYHRSTSTTTINPSLTTESIQHNWSFYRSNYATRDDLISFPFATTVAPSFKQDIRQAQFNEGLTPLSAKFQRRIPSLDFLLEQESDTLIRSAEMPGEPMQRLMLQPTSSMQLSTTTEDPIGKFRPEELPGIFINFVKQLRDNGSTADASGNEDVLKVLSPSLLSVDPNNDELAKKGVLSPSLFSLYNSSDSILPLPQLFPDMNPDEQKEWIDFILDASEARKFLKANATNPLLQLPIPSSVQNQTKSSSHTPKESLNPSLGKNDFKQILGNNSDRIFAFWESFYKNLLSKQLSDLKEKGYAFMEPQQLRSVYGEKGPNGKMDVPFNETAYAQLKTEEQRERELRRYLVWFAESQAKQKVSKGQRRAKRAIVLTPLVFTAATINAPATLSMPIVLSPIVFSPLILSPSVLGPIILSPLLFSPLILSPRALGPLILSPSVASPLILNPMVLNPLILSPAVMQPLVLSPLALSPLILSPGVMNPLILSPFVLTPLILSPQVLFALVLSPYALSPLIESPLAVAAVVLSPSVLS